MLKPHVHAHINDKAPNCEHNFIATNTKKTEKHDSVTQMVCQRCLLLVNFEDVASGCAAYREASLNGPTDCPPGNF